MGPEVDEFSLVPASNDPRVRETSHTGTNLDRSSTGKVQYTVFECPSVNVPNPASDRCIDEGNPEEDEEHGGHQASSFGDGTHKNCDGNAAEFKLEEGVKEGWNER